MKDRAFHIRLGFAVTGILTVVRRERSFRTQLTIAIAAVIVVAAMRPTLVWCALLLVALVQVLALKMINSALEYLMDHVHPDSAEAIGAAKDAAAGAVLIASVAALLCGALAIMAFEA